MIRKHQNTDESIEDQLSNSVSGRTITISEGLLRLDRLLVCLDVEVDEETEVAGEQEAAEQRRTLGAGARAHGRELV